MTWQEWEIEQQYLCDERLAIMADSITPERIAEFEQSHPIQTARDRYGWRGLPGTTYLRPPREGERR